jgi:hypothetical protein
VKYMLLMFGSTEGWGEEMAAWPEDDLQEHIAYQQRVGEELAGSGELVDGQGLGGPALAKTVESDGAGPPAVTDGLYAESKEVLAGYWMVDVEDESRAIEIAAKVSAAPGPGGTPLRQPIQVHPVLDASGTHL